MTTFGPTDSDLPLLRLLPPSLSRVDQEDLHLQLNHHCIRIAWREHARTKAPVRGLLRQAAAAAYTRLYRIRESKYFDQEMLCYYLDDVQHTNEIEVCFGFFLPIESFVPIRDALRSDRPKNPDSILQGPHVKLRNLSLISRFPNPFRAAYQRVLFLEELWHKYRYRASTDTLARRTIQLVAAATGEDPQISDCLALRINLSMAKEISDLIQQERPYSIGHEMSEEEYLQELENTRIEMGQPTFMEFMADARARDLL